MSGRHSFLGLSALALAALIATARPVSADGARTLVQSTHPYWDVGDNDPALGRLCAVGKFNEIEVDRYVARFNGTLGPAVLGIAKGTGLNLRDPEHKRVATEDYFFYDDGDSDCSVYVGGRKAKK